MLIFTYLSCRISDLTHLDLYVPVTITGAREQPSMLEQSSADREIPTDQSSVCAEVEKDPFMVAQREKERVKAGR